MDESSYPSDRYFAQIKSGNSSTVYALREQSPQEILDSIEFRKKMISFPDDLKMYLTSSDLDLLEKAARHEQCMKGAFIMGPLVDHSYLGSNEYELVIHRCRQRKQKENS